jgi:diguanylate cyclase (GGDEF)-like protein
MIKPFGQASEPNEVYVALVSELYEGWVPTAIMGTTFVGIGIFCAFALGESFLLLPTLAGGLLTAVKLALLIASKRGDASLLWDRTDAARWEWAYALTSIGFAAMVAVVAAATFGTPNLSVQMLATGMLFGYCSGVVARTSVRPRIAMAASATAAIPVIMASASFGQPGHWILAGVFAIFLAGSFESILHVHQAASRQIAMRLDMATLARHDPLTGLANRLGLREGFRNLSANGRPVSMVAVYCFDLDRFKPVNDRFGHPTGDALLQILGERIRATIQAGDIAARIGGDEFVLVHPIQLADEAEMFARRLTRAITAAYDIAGNAIQIGVSLGYATSPPEMRDLDDLIVTADAALYRSKQSGGGIARGDAATAAA